MKRRTEHLVQKRDGRREFLRATKLARSIHLALQGAGIDEDWRAIELAGVVIEALRRKRSAAAAHGEAVLLTTAEIADAAQQALVATGQPAAAVQFGAVAAERRRRRQSLVAMERQAGGGVLAPALPGCRLSGE
jgi:uncharacterized protein (UPF0218 family)